MDNRSVLLEQIKDKVMHCNDNTCLSHILATSCTARNNTVTAHLDYPDKVVIL
uniref:Uncharacterized protein n=1 Tax=Arundo donax TaxID=35708 RepID=A0A0A9ED68_ARUDO